MKQRNMRRFKQQLTEDECIEIVQNTTAGVLSLCGEDNKPYGVPLSHVYENGNLYFHSALNGHKIDVLEQNANACFTIIDKDEIHPEKFTTYFRSVIAFGEISIIREEKEKQHILEIIGHRCNPSDSKGLMKEISVGFKRCHALKLRIDRITGKQAIELVNRP